MFGRMLLSYVLRLVPEALAEGRFAGTVQIIDTGRTVPFASVDELLAALVPRPRDGSDPSRSAQVLDIDAGPRQARAAGPQAR
jgi:hypothetical protein